MGPYPLYFVATRARARRGSGTARFSLLPKYYTPNGCRSASLLSVARRPALAPVAPKPLARLVCGVWGARRKSRGGTGRRNAPSCKRARQAQLFCREGCGEPDGASTVELRRAGG